MPSPQVAEQSLSFAEVQPSGQQPSSLVHVSTSLATQAVVQSEPVSWFSVQATPSLHVRGQSPSQDSPGSTTPLPHKEAQSLSLLAVQPSAQQRPTLRPPHPRIRHR